MSERNPLAEVIWKNLDDAGRRAVLERPVQSVQQSLKVAVAGILAQVRAGGDEALRELTERFDGVRLAALRVTADEIDAAVASLSDAERAALTQARDNIRRFHEAQRRETLSVETMAGVVCEKLVRPVGRVGLYVPGGSAPLPSTVLMLGVPAQIAGCGVKVLCTPPGRDGRINPWILTAARLCGIEDVYKIGGAQAIAAMAFGTPSIPKVDKIFGPGNSYVTEAKLQVAQEPGGAAFDMPAGPSEVMVIADDAADPAFVAADLLSQAEHGPDSQVMLVCFSSAFAEAVRREVASQSARLARETIVHAALDKSRTVIAASRGEAMEIANAYAPEHLILQVREPRSLLPQVQAAGSVFLGALTPESMGDYASGTNHVLPTYGYARAYSGLALADFERSLSVQEVSLAGLRALGPVVERIASAEGLEAHANAVRLRLEVLGR